MAQENTHIAVQMSHAPSIPRCWFLPEGEWFLSFNNFNIKDRLVYGITVFIPLIRHQIKRETENNIKTGTQNLPVMLSRSSTPVTGLCVGVLNENAAP